MKLLVTGGLGFIGSNFILRVFETSKDIEIVNIDDELHGSNHKSLSKIKNLNKYKFVKGNINDFELMDNLISNCDIVVNFAAESHVDRSISNAKPFINSNIMGVFSILEAIKKNKKKLIHISTDEVFGSLKEGTANEKFNFNPSSPYAASKASAELLIKSYVKTFDCDCVITRCTNNYGPRQFLEKLIPKIIILAKQNKQIPVYGSGKNIRDWIYVEDHCDAILKVLKKGRKGESYNISANNEIDNLTIIKKILSIIGKSTDLISYVEDRPGHDFRYSLDSKKIRKELGWVEKVNFQKGIKTTINWYLENENWWEITPEEEWKDASWRKSN
jgi:dTDP-glucose 4,6-dehydratase